MGCPELPKVVIWSDRFFDLAFRGLINIQDVSMESEPVFLELVRLKTSIIASRPPDTFSSELHNTCHLIVPDRLLPARPAIIAASIPALWAAPGYWGNGKPVFDFSVPSTMTSRNENGNPIPILSPSNFAISLLPGNREKS